MENRACRFIFSPDDVFCRLRSDGHWFVFGLPSGQYFNLIAVPAQLLLAGPLFADDDQFAGHPGLIMALGAAKD